jgi:hypothetical protein
VAITGIYRAMKAVKELTVGQSKMLEKTVSSPTYKEGKNKKN